MNANRHTARKSTETRDAYIQITQYTNLGVHAEPFKH